MELVLELAAEEAWYTWAIVEMSTTVRWTTATAIHNLALKVTPGSGNLLPIMMLILIPATIITRVEAV